MTARRTTTGTALTADLNPTRNIAMLMHEDLARTRMREAEHSAERQRLVHRISAARRWRRISGWAERRALQLADQL
ncbi:hypothetical protein F0L68_11315 [Solihabitans fulvus]|uniref:Uncharacterized protein n=1 Tax=Solihabitans fulvus TaxID=1892852 RepID=A0A5B2XIV8_9PSEU|nr:hypothetical protein [Solihabitans fulvus]KAA2262821.1 hypothetical protein F0L68_11315 [Solihabitans fulvus]